MGGMILLADPNSRAWSFSKKIQEYILKEKKKDVRLEKVSISHFRNGELSIYVPENVRKKEVYFIHDSTKNPQEWWVELLMLKDLLLSSSAESVSLVLPDMLYSRQDRKDKPHVPISARALAKSLSTGVKRIITMDLHAPQVQGFYPENIPLDNLYSFTVFSKYLTKEKNKIDNVKKLVILSPDAGGVDRAKSFAQRLESEYPVAFIEKRRVKAGEIEDMRLAGDVDGKDVLIVDDIIDSGNTLCKAAELLKQHGAQKLFCYGTHGIFTLGTEKLCECFDRLMTSNTHNQEREGVESIDVSPIFAEAIYRAQKGESISELFK
jgi:ribose-phosphate pyrophosphokinase